MSELKVSLETFIGRPAARGWFHDAAKSYARHEREHIPNLTSTDQAYLPPGHTLCGGKRDRGTGDCEPWTPD